MQSMMTALFVWLLGLAVGSFLNVVIYRLPLGLSLSQPRWSFCPHCGGTIRWFDNLPVIGWVLLGGRCRACRAPISLQYPLVEALTGLVFVLTWHLLSEVGARAGLQAFALPRDWPYLLAWLVLAAALIAVAAMDIVSYSLDIRVTEFAVFAGCVLHAVWAQPAFHLPLAQSAWGAAAAAAFVVMVLLIALTVWRADGPAAEAQYEEQHEMDSIGDTDQSHPAPAQATRTLAGAGVAALMLAALLIVCGSSAAPSLFPSGLAQSLQPVALGLIFAVMVAAGSLRRQADELVHAAVEAEAPDARGTALRELRWLLPIVLAGAGGFFVLHYVGADGWSTLVSWRPWPDRPILAGLVYAVHGTIIAAGVGWLLRLVFTLIFGREAFGTGDIYILGAAGATAGWDIALLGLGISIALAMASWLISQFMKNTLMIPFGPPLALGVLFALWLNAPAAELAKFYVENLTATAREQPRLLVILGGVMVIGFGAALLAARAVRQLVEPRGSAGEDVPPALGTEQAARGKALKARDKDA